ncbi:MAG: Ig-like domain-containing protein [Chitinophagaceae bacterium]|nr:Ig-like domain-containing protein [Chitinophagaceae bacterium]
MINPSLKILLITLLSLAAFSCKKKSPQPPPVVTPPAAITVTAVKINGKDAENNNAGINAKPTIIIQFSKAVKQSTLATSISLSNDAGTAAGFSTTVSPDETQVNILPSSLNYLTKYNLTISNTLEAKDGGKLASAETKVFATALDSSRKFTAITDAELLTKVQQQTFRYFWDFAHPISGLAREGSKHAANIVTSGGSGFGIMAILVAIERGFITRSQGFQRMQTIVAFLKNTAQNFHGVYPHWLDGATGATIPFSTNDNGADLVETSFLMQGLITVRQYFNGADALETALRSDINTIINRVEWNWFQQNNQNVLYWHWSPDKAWAMNHKIQGWNECFITYILAASSANYSITKAVYDQGWARNGAIKNGKQFYGITLPLGEDYGGPMFFEHYSFLGLNPTNLSDNYAVYKDQAKNHALINYNYCKANPKQWYGYSDSVWGLTASNIRNGYTASSPTNDQGFIAPTAALSSMPFTPDESMAALKFYYYVLGDKIFKEYGFTDAFSLDVLRNGAWFDDAFLAIDQGPIIVMIENYRTGLLWNLFMSAPEVKTGLQKLGFSGY